MMCMCFEVFFQEGCGLISEQSKAVQAFAEPTVCSAFCQVVGERGDKMKTHLWMRAQSQVGKLKQNQAAWYD